MSDQRDTGALRMGRVALTVHDLSGMADYYARAVGLDLLAMDGESARLGAGGEVLIELRADKAARRSSPREAGLFHTAFLLPSRADLGAWARDAASRQTPVAGASDHLVSEAVYLTDPEGNGIEIYIDRPTDAWSWNGTSVAMSSDPLDVQGLLRAGGNAPWKGAPVGTTIGHVHLQVGHVAEADRFFTEVLGLGLHATYPGASFYAANRYHHHIAANIWNSRGAHPRDLPATGLAEVEVILAPERASAIAARAGQPITDQRLELQDPWGTPFALTLR